MAEPRPPDARTHLPRPLERRLLKPYAGSALGRVASGAAARALSVLVRKHPRAALHAVAAGFSAAGRIGWAEARGKAAALLGLEGNRRHGRVARGGEEAAAADYPPELVEATRRRLEAELDRDELERARRLLEESERKRSR
jgi:hypothetical protein